MILVIDNYDSFTFNLVQALQAAGADVRVVRNDAIDRRRRRGAGRRPGRRPARDRHLARARATRTTPGVSVETVRVAAERGIPLLGVCLGMQSMAAAFGGVDRPRADARPRRGVRGDPRRRRPARGHAAVVHGRPLPLAGGRPGDAAARAAGDRDERGRPRGHGHPPRRAAARGRPVPPRDRCSRRRARTCSPTSCARPGRARRRGSTPRPARSRRPGMRRGGRGEAVR